MKAQSIWDYQTGFRLRLLRHSLKLSQTHVANNLEVALSEFQAFENGQKRLTPDLWIKLQKIYDVDMESEISKYKSFDVSQHILANENERL